MGGGMIMMAWAVISMTALGGTLGASSWPAIRPARATYHFPDAEKVQARETIYGQDAKPLYVLECYAYSAAPKTPAFNYSGDFECVLHPYGTDRSFWTLLTELPNADRDWESRGRFLTAQLVEPCGEYQDLGRKRTFRLRGFKLTLNLTHVLFDNQKQNLWRDGPALKSFDLEIAVVPDPTATSDIAATPRLPPMDSLPEACREAFDTLYLYQFRHRRHLY
jgi:hypothetical protein